MTIASFKANYVVLEPITPDKVPNGAIFLDASNMNSMSIKDSGGITKKLEPSTDTSMFIKQMQVDAPIAIRMPFSKLASGKIVLADSDAVGGQKFCGYTLGAATEADQLINVLCVGANLTGAILGLGFTPGDDVYLSEDGGYTNNINALTGDNDSIIKVGVADCSAGLASTVADDLIAFPEILLRP